MIDGRLSGVLLVSIYLRKLDPIAPVIFVTADSRPEVGQSAQASGCDAVVLKPHEPQRLLVAVQELVEPTIAAA